MLPPAGTPPYATVLASATNTQIPIGLLNFIGSAAPATLWRKARAEHAFSDWFLERQTHLAKGAVFEFALDKVDASDGFGVVQAKSVSA